MRQVESRAGRRARRVGITERSAGHPLPLRHIQRRHCHRGAGQGHPGQVSQNDGALRFDPAIGDGLGTRRQRQNGTHPKSRVCQAKDESSSMPTEYGGTWSPRTGRSLRCGRRFRTPLGDPESLEGENQTRSRMSAHPPASVGPVMWSTRSRIDGVASRGAQLTFAASSKGRSFSPSPMARTPVAAG